MRYFALEKEPIAERQQELVEASEVYVNKRDEAPRCPLCGKYIGLMFWRPPFRIELEVWGDQWADIIELANDRLVSTRFVEAWGRSRLIGLSGFESIEVDNVQYRRRKLGPPPAYHRGVVCRSRTAIDQHASGFEWNAPPTCSECRTPDLLRRWRRIVFEPGSWGGEDIFFARGLHGSVFVTERFRDFCEAYRMKNTRFVPIEQYEHDFYARRRVDGSIIREGDPDY